MDVSVSLCFMLLDKKRRDHVIIASIHMRVMRIHLHKMKSLRELRNWAPTTYSTNISMKSKLGIRTNSLYHTIVIIDIVDIIDIVGHLLTTCITLNIIVLVIRCTKIVMVQHSSRFLLSSEKKQTKWNTHKSIFNNILTK